MKSGNVKHVHVHSLAEGRIRKNSCLNIHTVDARKMGETEQRIYCVSAWQECEFYTEAEKVALELAEHVTLIPTKRVPDELYQRVRVHYNEKQYVDLILIINQINSWNRISNSMGNIVTENLPRGSFMKTTIISLKDEAKTRKLIIDEAFWDNVVEICFESTCIRFRVKSGDVEKIMHHWLYEAVNDPNNSELDKYHLYKREGCEYRFPKENEAFVDWIFKEAKKRGVFTQY